MDNIIKKLDLFLSEKEDNAYQKFMKKKLEEYGVKSIAELNAEQKKKFFNEIDKEYKAKSE
jgi:hypothetical protein